MIILRTRHFSFSDRKMIPKIIEKLEKLKVEDYEISNKIPSDVISISSDLNSTYVYIPKEFEYSQYDIDDCVRSLVPHARTSTKYDRNIYIMKISIPLKLDQYCKLVKYIAEEWEFCTILED